MLIAEEMHSRQVFLSLAAWRLTREVELEIYLGAFGGKFQQD